VPQGKHCRARRNFWIRRPGYYADPHSPSVWNCSHSMHDLDKVIRGHQQTTLLYIGVNCYQALYAQ